MGVTSIRLNAEVAAPLENLGRKLDRSKIILLIKLLKSLFSVSQWKIHGGKIR